MKRSYTLALTVLISASTLLTAGCAELNETATGIVDTANEYVASNSPQATAAPAEATEAIPAETGEFDYYTVTGPAQLEHEAYKDAIGYCPMDALHRAQCAYGELTSESRDMAQSRGREDIITDPTGWVGNDEVHIPALDTITGSKDYNGWMFNRSHLMADSLGGDSTALNLVTGTRTQNIGSAEVSGQYAGGMAHTELIARDYLDSAAAKTCSLYYAAQANYNDDELIPQTVTVDIQSCDKTIDQRVTVFNTANGFTIDYSDGAFSLYAAK